MIIQNRPTSAGSVNVSTAGIVASGTELLLATTANLAERQKYGSLNSMVVTNISQCDVLITLDGTTPIGMVPKDGGSLQINPTDGLYFDTVKLTNLDAGIAVGADEIKIFATRVNGVI